MSQRRLPVYFLLDCSESMIGDSIAAVQKGVELLLRQLRSDPNALELAYVSFITFNSTAQQIIPLSELTEVQPPKLQVRPGTALGAAFKLLHECISREVKKTTSERKGDYRPIVFLLTDGQPTDNWQGVKTAISRLANPRIAMMYAIGCGDDVDFEVLHDACDAVFKLDDMSPEKLQKLFIWLSASVQSASAAVGGSETIGGIDLGKKPPEVEVVNRGSQPHYSGPPRQVFLKMYCSSKGRPYLVRYRMNPEYERYTPVAAHPLEATSEKSSEFQIPPINSSMILGMASCPYCNNPSGVVCTCGCIMCMSPTSTEDMRCPQCRVKFTLDDCGSGGDFTVDQSAG